MPPPATVPALPIRQLGADDAEAYRAFALQGYTTEPDAFTSTPRERADLPIDWWRRRLAAPGGDSMVLAADASGVLAGVVGLEFEARERTRHKATLFGMFVSPLHRRMGIGRALVEAAIRAASQRPHVSVLQLTVTEGNDDARHLYEACGFEVFGVEPFAVRGDHGFQSKVHMWRSIADDR